jgi:uncharacterized membrane protein YedE/YeeE
MDDDVIRYGVRTIRLWVAGILSAVIALPFLAVTIFRVPFAGGFDFADGIMLFGLVMFTGMAVYGIGLAARQPVAMRLDRHGISGYFAHTLDWTDIRKVYSGASGRDILLDLWDPGAFWSRQGIFSRLNSALSLQAGMVAIRVDVLKAPGPEILQTVQDLHARFGRQADA